LHVSDFRYIVPARVGAVAVVDGHHPEAKKGTIMQLIVLAVIVIVGLGIYRYMRTRSAH
jgi:hypothetical protein